MTPYATTKKPLSLRCGAFFLLQTNALQETYLKIFQVANQ